MSNQASARAWVAELAVLLAVLLTVLLALPFSLAACGGSSSPDRGNGAAPETGTETPGGYDFDRSDPEAGVANIMEAFTADRATAECIFDAWGDVANVPPAELTPELMTFPICETSILQLMTGDAGLTSSDPGSG